MQGKKEGLAIRVAKPVIDYLKKKQPKKSILVIYVNRKFFLRQLKQSISFKLKWQSYNIHGGLICKEAE